jgi:hypothetical protein
MQPALLLSSALSAQDVIGMEQKYVKIILFKKN